jgi:limonene-1,2-epoxide hydrolase
VDALGLGHFFELAEEDFGRGDGDGFARAGETYEDRIEVGVQITLGGADPNLALEDRGNSRDRGPLSPDRGRFEVLGVFEEAIYPGGALA